MRRLITVLGICFVTNSMYGQDLPTDKETGKVTYSEIIDAPRQSKDVIYSKVRGWVSEKFRSSKAVIDLEDKENGKLVAKGNIDAGVLKNGINKVSGGHIDFTMTFLIKDDKLKVVSTNFVHEAPAFEKLNVIGCGAIENEKCGNGMTSIPTNKQWKQIKEDMNVTVIGLYDSIKKTLTAKDAMDF